MDAILQANEIIAAWWPNTLRHEPPTMAELLTLRDQIAQLIAERDEAEQRGREQAGDYKRRFERLLDVFTWNEDRRVWTIHPHFQAWVNEATAGLERDTAPRGEG